jgi:hypothetical protein
MGTVGEQTNKELFWESIVKKTTPKDKTASITTECPARLDSTIILLIYLKKASD